VSDYRNSNYALNKFSEGIVYQFSGEIRVVTMEDYLKENTDKTEEDFWELKKLSDQIYHEELLKENIDRKRTISMTNLENVLADTSPSMEDRYIKTEEMRCVRVAVIKLFSEGRLTSKQKERFIKHFFRRKSLREIAREEGVYFTSVNECIWRAVEKLKRYFNEEQREAQKGE